MDPSEIQRIADQVVEELRGMGLVGTTPAAPRATGGTNDGSAAAVATRAIIREYGPARAAVSPQPQTGADSAPRSVGPRPGGALRPEEPGVSADNRPTVTCNVSNRHIHLTAADLATLFGPEAVLEPRNELMQPFQFAARQTVSLIAGRGRTIEHVRILGPLRKYTQVEISRTDGFYLGINPPVRASGDIAGSAGATLVGPKGTLVLKHGLIVADRHIHTPPDVARRFGLADNQMIRVRIGHTEKPTVMERVRIRIQDDFLFEMHIDNDDANASGHLSGDRVELII